jgi:CheY-like chemotaxis protein
VEDDPVTRNLYRQIILGNFGDLTVVMGIDGEDGWREFQESQPIMVITDSRMETSDAGLRLAKKIKEVSNTPVILITGEELKEVTGVDYLLPKPFKVKVLVDVIKKFSGKG